MNTRILLEKLLTKPAPADLRALQMKLLVAEGDPHRAQAARRALGVAREFHSYLSEFEAKASAREYSELASLLDMGAVGGVALENLIDAGETFWQQILLGGLSETLMVLASRQYIKAWGREMRPIHMQAAWYLRDQLWQLAVAGKPDMPAGERAALIDKLLAPGLDNEAADEARVALLGRLFQALLIVYVSVVLSE